MLLTAEVVIDRDYSVARFLWGKNESRGPDLTSNLALLDFLHGGVMHNAFPLSLAALVSAGIIVIGCFYVASPQRILGGFGLKPPAPDIDTLAWLRLKGIRDIASGFAVLILMLTTNSRTVGILLLVFAHHPFRGHVQYPCLQWAEGNRVLRSWSHLCRYAGRGPLFDPCHLSETMV